MSEGRVETFARAHLLRRNLAVPLVALAGAVIGVTLCYHRAADARLLGFFLAWMGCWIAPLTFLRRSFPLARPATVTASADALTIDGEDVPVEDIAEARTVPRARRAGETIVELSIRGRRRVELSMPPGDAARLLETIGARAGERRAPFVRVIPYATRLAWVSGLVGVPWITYLLLTMEDIVPLFFLVPGGILPLCAVLAVVCGVFRGKVVVGAEGFTASWFGLRRLHRFAEVETIVRKPKGLGGVVVETVVVLRSQRRVAISILDAPDTNAQRGAETRAFADTLEGAFERWKRAPAVAELGAHLGRGQRSASEWLTGIDGLIRGGGQSYRVAAVTPEVLADVARSAEASSDARIGAAAALLRLGDAKHRVTVRVAAEACAEPATRAALLELADAEGDEHKVELALARVR